MYFINFVCNKMSVGCLSYRALINPQINLFKTKSNRLYIKNQSVLRSKHFPPRL